MIMLHLFTIFLTLVLFETASCSTWDYNNEAKWPPLCREGKKQSPINLESDSAVETNYAPFSFYGYNQTYRYSVKNNGHTANFKAHSAPGYQPKISGGGLENFYNFDSIHFHWSSEHEINSVRFPLEMHLVHYRNGFKDLDEAKTRKGVAVFAVLFDLSPEEDEEFQPVTEIVERLIARRIDDIEVIDIKLEDLLPRDTAGFFRYDGSLTTPGCEEGVIWTVFTNTIPLSKRQIQTFAKLRTLDNHNMGKNYRSLQSLYDRKVFLKVSPVRSFRSSSPNIIAHNECFIVVLFACLFNFFY